jgi:hypothetical protein
MYKYILMPAVQTKAAAAILYDTRMTDLEY